MNDQTWLGSAKIGTLGGFITTLLFSIPASDMIKTAVTAAIGAAVSFFMSVLLKYCISRWRK